MEHWDSHVWNSRWFEGRFRNLYDRWSMVVKLSDRVEVEWFKQISPISEPQCDEIPVSGIGTIAAARIIPRDAPPFIAASMYARWISPHPSTQSKWSVGMPDGSAHRIISDLSAFIGDADPGSHRILAAGDMNMSLSPFTNDPLGARVNSVVTRMEALGIEWIGPRFPEGRRADPWPPHLPPDSLDVPTYHSNRQCPATAQTQLDHVFASRGFHTSVTATALNSVEEWGPSDHCRLLIRVGPAVT